MDFSPTPEQQDAAELAAKILGDRCTQERLRDIEGSGTRFDADLWRELGAAGLVGLALPEEHGGGGLGLLELLAVVVEAGRVTAPLPLAWHGPAALAVAEFGTDEQQATWLPDAAAGRSVLTAAVTEDHAFAPERPTTSVRQSDEGWVITGAKTVVPSGTVADLFLVPAATSGDAGDGVTVFLVRPTDEGVRVDGQTVNDGDLVARLELDDVLVPDERVLGAGRGAEVAHWLTQRLTVGVCALQLGVLEGALSLTADYARQREQFGRPIGTFQAVSQRLANGYIDVQGARLTLWQAAWRLSEGLAADLQVATAKLIAADAGHAVAHTTVHVHGGVGIDLDGAAHRFYSAAKRHELSLGGGTEQARAVGRVLAAEPA